MNPRIVLYDRRPEWTVQNRVDWTLNELNNPSLLDGPPDSVERALRLQDVRFVIAYSQPAREVLEAIMRPVSHSDIMGELDSAARSTGNSAQQGVLPWL